MLPPLVFPEATIQIMASSKRYLKVEGIHLD
jgi:hypothetical protein